MIRVLAYSIASLIGLLCLLAGVLVFSAGNPSTSAWILQQAASRAPGKLVLENIQGDLLSGVSVESLRYDLTGFRITAADATVRISWPLLIQRKLVIEQLAAAQLGLEILETGAAEPGDGLPTVTLPLEIRLDALDFARLRFAAAGIEELLSAVTGRVKISGSAIDIPEFIADIRGFNVWIGGRLNTRDNYPLDAQVRWRAIDGPVSGSGTVSGNLSELSFTHRIELPDPIDIAGVLRSPIDDPNIDASANWEEVTLDAGEQGPIRITGGRASLQGRPAAYDIQLSASVTAAPLPTLLTEFVAQGDSENLDIARLSVRGFGGEINANGRAIYAEKRLTLSLTGTGLDPASINPDLTGQLGGVAQLEARWPGQLNLDIEKVAGEILGQPVSARGRITASEQRLNVSDLQVVSGDNRLNIDADILPSLAGNITVDARNLAGLWPGLAGSIQGSATVTGTMEKPVIKADLRGSKLAYGDLGAAKLIIRGEIDTRQHIEGLIRAENLRSGERIFGDLDFSAAGRLADHQVDIELTEGLVKFDMQSQAAWDGALWSHQVTTAQVDTGPAGLWRLSGPFALKLGTTAIDLGANCWEQDAARLCLRDSFINETSLSAEGQLTGFPLATFQPWLGEELNVSGTADADFALRRDRDAVTGEMTWAQNSTRLIYKDSENSSIETELGEVRFSASGTEKSTLVEASIRSDYGIAVDLSATLMNLLTDAAEIDGELRIRAPDLEGVAPLIDRYLPVNNLQGSLQADLRVSGPPDRLRIGGTGSLTGGSADLPGPGIRIEDVELSLAGSDTAPLQLSGRATSGGGTLGISGTLDWSDTIGAFAELAVTGENFQIIRLPNQAIFVSPNLNTRIEGRQISLNGKVAIPKAEIVIEAIPESAVTPSADVVIESEDSSVIQPRQAPFEIIGSLEVTIEEAAHFSGFGIDTRLAGTLSLSRAPGASTSVAEGNVRTVAGSFAAYGKALAIERGVLIFAGPLDDPALDVRASRSLKYEGEDITVGVLLSGKLSNIQTKLFSEPVMGDTDVLSYLVLNRPITGTGDIESADLSGAALAIGLSQALPITQQAEDAFGLDELGFEGAGGDTTSIVAGKRISQRIYVRYAYGLFNNIGTIIVRYNLRGGVSIEAGSGAEQTLELVFTIER